MSTNPTGLAANLPRPAAVNQKSSNPAPTNTGPRTDAFAKATAPTNSPAPVTTAVAAPGSAPAAPVGGTTVPTATAVRTSPNAPAPQMSSQVAAMAMATSGVFFAQVASAAVVTSGKKSSDVSGKDESTDRAQATEADEKNNLALKDSNSQTGNEAGDISGASGPGAATA